MSSVIAASYGPHMGANQQQEKGFEFDPIGIGPLFPKRKEVASVPDSP